MNEQTLLLRQISPSWYQNGRVTSLAFKPTKKDGKRLSVYDGDKIDAETSWRHYTEVLKNKSLGVLGVSGDECSQLSLQFQPDPEPFPEHAVIDFGTLTNSQTESCAKVLTRHATARGWLFQAS